MLKVRPQFYDLADRKVDKLLDFSIVLPEIKSLIDDLGHYDHDGIIYVYRVLKSLSQDAGYFASYFHQMPLEWRMDVSIEDLEAFDRYKDRLNVADMDLMVCMDLLEQLRFDDVVNIPGLTLNYLQRCYDLLSGYGLRDGLYHISLFDFVFKWIIRRTLMNDPHRYGISCLEDLGSLLVDFRTKWHSIICFRTFLQENLSNDKYRLLINDSRKFYIDNSGYFDRAFLVGATIGIFDDFMRPAFALPNINKRWNLSGKKLEGFLNRVAYQPGFMLFKDDYINTINNLKDVKFQLPSDYEFPVVTHVNWR